MLLPFILIWQLETHIYYIEKNKNDRQTILRKIFVKSPRRKLRFEPKYSYFGSWGIIKMIILQYARSLKKLITFFKFHFSAIMNFDCDYYL